MLSQLKNHSILYVEDEPKIQVLIAKYLENYFDVVYVAQDGKEALNSYNTHHPDVILLDIDLPYITGLDIAKEIRKTNKSIKIIMLTAYAEKEKLLKATELKLTKYLIKPIDPQDFKDVMSLLSEELMEDPSQFVHIAPKCIWDKDRERLSLDDNQVFFTEKEQHLFKLLVARKGQTVSYEDIMIAVWDDAYNQEITIDAVKILMSRMRKKLPEDCISSVYGKGYTLL